jgi:DegV family protein with EDD domain
MIKIVTDSTCDLPADLARTLDITVLPMVINMEGRSYYDGVDITRTEYYQRLPALKTLPTTAASGAGAFETVYRRLGEAEIVSIHIGAAFSGVLNMAKVGAEASGQRVTLVDSQQVSMGLGWQVAAAAETAGAGGSLQNILDAVTSLQKRVKVLALLDTLEYLRRGGRANALTAALSNLLQIKLIIEVANSKITPLARTHTRGRGMDKLVETVESLTPLERLAVLHADNPAGAQVLAQRVAHCLSPTVRTPLIVTDVTAIVGTHAGPGAVGVALVRAESQTST